MKLLACAIVLASTVGFVIMPSSSSAGTLYDDLGGTTSIKAFISDTVDGIAADPVIGKFFKKTKLERLKNLLFEQVCNLSGGPCEYSGVNMKKAHVGLKIQTRDFNILVEILQDAMDKQDIPYATQNRLLAILAPMHRDVVENQ